jgi:hypothetical protein
MNTILRLGELLKLGAQMSSDFAIGDDETKHEEGIIPSLSQQGKWRYAVIERPEGKAIQFDSGSRVFEWQYESDKQPQMDDPKALPVNFKRNADKDRDTFGLGAAATGTMQVHRAGPDQIYATLQDGRRNLTFNMHKMEGGRWVMVPKAPRAAPAVPRQFVTRIEESATAANQPAQPAEGAPSLPITNQALEGSPRV